MKLLNQLTALSFLTLVMLSCKKDEVELTPLASINVMNAVVDGKTLRLGSNKTDSATYMNFKQFGLIAGANSLYFWPTGDSTKPYVNRPISTNEGDVLSLFITGTVAAIDTVMIKENIPYRTDSTAGIRFINLSPNSVPLNVRLSTSSSNEVSNLAYKQYTSFLSYPGKYNSAYTFQVFSNTDPTTVLASFALSTSTVPRFANITLAIRGLVGGTGTQKINITRINNDR